MTQNRKGPKPAKPRKNTKEVRKQATLKAVRTLKKHRHQSNVTAEQLVRAMRDGAPTDARWHAGGLYQCPVCDREAFEGRTDLIHTEAWRGLHREYHNLRGAKCQSCHAQLIDPRDWVDIQRELNKASPVFRVEIVRGRFGRLAIKWPQALQQAWPMQKGTRLTLTPINPTMFLIRRRESEAKANDAYKLPAWHFPYKPTRDVLDEEG